MLNAFWNPLVSTVLIFTSMLSFAKNEVELVENPIDSAIISLGNASQFIQAASSDRRNLTSRKSEDEFIKARKAIEFIYISTKPENSNYANVLLTNTQLTEIANAVEILNDAAVDLSVIGVLENIEKRPALISENAAPVAVRLIGGVARRYFHPDHFKYLIEMLVTLKNNFPDSVSANNLKVAANAIRSSIDYLENADVLAIYQTLEKLDLLEAKDRKYIVARLDKWLTNDGIDYANVVGRDGRTRELTEVPTLQVADTVEAMVIATIHTKTGEKEFNQISDRVDLLIKALGKYSKIGTPYATVGEKLTYKKLKQFSKQLSGAMCNAAYLK